MAPFSKQTNLQVEAPVRMQVLTQEVWMGPRRLYFCPVPGDARLLGQGGRFPVTRLLSQGRIVNALAFFFFPLQSFVFGLWINSYISDCAGGKQETHSETGETRSSANSPGHDFPLLLPGTLMGDIAMYATLPFCRP